MAYELSYSGGWSCEVGGGKHKGAINLINLRGGGGFKSVNHQHFSN